VTTSNHVIAKAASGIAATAIVIKAAEMASRAYGVMAGVALIVAVFTACWLVFRVRPALHPARRSRASAPVVPPGSTSPEPARPELLPVL
jgi:hypothetical protein